MWVKVWEYSALCRFLKFEHKSVFPGVCVQVCVSLYLCWCVSVEACTCVQMLQIVLFSVTSA